MSGFRVLLLLVIALTIATAREKPNKSSSLITNHLRGVNPEFDDAEYMKFEASDNGKIAKNGNAKKENKPRISDDDKPKTLSQQIADGKYGLIHKELFSKPPKRPNVISYEFNPEVPNDTRNNLGGLDKNEIWLAENHLLVLRGGSFPPHDDKQDNNESPWAPLDNFKAPLHQVKIPKNPKVPPPFPVQLTENGPLQIVGTNFTRTINGTYEEALNAIQPPEGYPPFDAPFLPQPHHTDQTNATARPVALPIPVDPSGEYPAGVPFPPALLNGTLPPSLSYLPPGTVVLPPPNNQTDYSDYDDPSIYYPPPYSFFYPKDNASAVPPGPLVPGIVLPPPPNFFAPLEETPIPTRKPMRYRKPTTQLTIVKTTSTTKKPITQKTVKIYPVKNHQYIKEIKQTTTTTVAPKKSVTILPEVFTAPPARKKPGITILRPVTPSKVYLYDNEIPNKPFKHYGPPPVTTTQAPFRYHTTSHDIETNSVDQQQTNLRKAKFARTTVKPVQYYFYEEPERSNRRPKTNSYSDNNEPYYVRPKPIVPVRQKRPQYVYVTARPYNTQKPRFRFIQQAVNPGSFNVHINKIQQQIQKYYTTSRPTYRTVPKPVYQFSFQANNFQNQPEHFRPSPQVQHVPEKYTVEIQQAIEITPSDAPKYQNDQVYYQHTTERPFYSTRSPKYQQQNVATPRPISEYSFEATPNPIYQGYYTKPDENYFDDRTKTYFTMFGRKLQLPVSTTPLPPVESLEDDTLVNYVNPRPNINPDAEIIPVKDYPNVVRYPPRQAPDNPEVIKAIPVEVPSKQSQDGSFISYQLPGDDGAHFYFLTPQLARSRDQGVGYFYSKARRRRNEKTVDR